MVPMSPMIAFPLVILIGWGIYAVLRPGGVFVVRIRGGVPRSARGVVTAGFLRDVAEVCARHGVRRGTLRGVAIGRRIRLEFSADIPEACRQQLRNVWGVAGWSVGGPGGPRRTA